MSVDLQISAVLSTGLAIATRRHRVCVKVQCYVEPSSWSDIDLQCYRPWCHRHVMLLVLLAIHRRCVSNGHFHFDENQRKLTILDTLPTLDTCTLLTFLSLFVCFDEIRRLLYFALKIFRDFFSSCFDHYAVLLTVVVLVRSAVATQWHRYIPAL